MEEERARAERHTDGPRSEERDLVQRKREKHGRGGGLELEEGDGVGSKRKKLRAHRFPSQLTRPARP